MDDATAVAQPPIALTAATAALAAAAALAALAADVHAAAELHEVVRGAGHEVVEELEAQPARLARIGVSGRALRAAAFST